MLPFFKQHFMSGEREGKESHFEGVTVLECSPSEQLGSLPASIPPPFPSPEMGHHGAFFRAALCLQYNVAEGNGADTTGNLAVS